MMYANQSGPLKDSTVAQISAFVYYEAAVISKLTTNKQFQNAFTKVMFDQINLDFGNYIDALARSRPKSLHHVYELILRLGQDPLTFDEAAFVVPEDDSDPEYTLKRDLKSSIDKLAWINSFISSL